MKQNPCVLFFLIFCSATSIFSQTVSTTPVSTRAREVIVTPYVAPTPTPLPRGVTVTNTLPPPAAPTSRPTVAPAPLPTPTVFINPNNQSPVALLPIAAPTPKPPPTFYKPLSFAQIKSRIAEAKRLMLTRPLQTALTDPTLTTDYVRIAFYDYKTARVDYIVITKDAFLDKNNAEVLATTADGKLLTVRNVRANGVNTPVLVIDAENKAHLPLIVQYPVERDGKFYEMAFYMSTHPGIVTPEVVNAGRIYVRNIIDAARTNLQKKGVYISPQVTDMAEKLSIVEHVDHQRFRSEYQLNIFNDIFALYALNEGQTYRYSVSSAGAGGMVQMISSTYNMIRSRYPTINLMPDFVEGMRNHTNATTAMLLYMQMTWSDLTASDTINQALADGTATPSELMSAGYNSNPAKLAGYIKRGGDNWRNLIPRETQIYLQINASMDRFVPYVPRTK